MPRASVGDNTAGKKSGGSSLALLPYGNRSHPPERAILIVSLYSGAVFFARVDARWPTIQCIESRFRSNAMDIIYLAILAILAGLTGLFARACARLAGEGA